VTPPRADEVEGDVEGEASALSQLAALFGIVPEFTDNDGRRRVTPDHTTRALLAAMGTDASTDEAVRVALAAHHQAHRQQLLPPLAVVKAHADRGVRVELTVPPGWGARRATCQLLLDHEAGGQTEVERRVKLPAQGHSFGVWIRPCPAPGYHRLQVNMAVDDDERVGEQQLVVHPGRCAMPLASGSRVFGLWANLYSLRSERNWGFGDFGDLARLAHLGGSVGAAFTGVNPLHALHDEAGSTSPYSPISRLFTNPLYLDVEAIPEWADDSACQAAREQPSFQRALASARQQTRLDYPALWKLKRPMLLLAHKAFVARNAETQTTRGQDYRRWCDEQGEPLLTFATFMALCDGQTASANGSTDWREWPPQWSDRGSPEVAAFAAQHPDTVDFHRWLQFACHDQLGHAAHQAGRSGQRLGLYQDLAIGTPPWAADIWAQPELFVKGVRIGCPPDAFASEGQDWNLTPLSPSQIMNGGWRYWRGVLRAAMAHGGVLRIDHVMGLFRQYWIPAGASAKSGAYVRFPGETLLGILALESSRNHTLVVGEDLGTVPEGLSARLAQAKILSSRVALFERDGRGAFRPSSSFSKRALLTATTHDLPPLDALWGDDDLILRRRLGQIPDDDGLAAAREERRALLAALRRRVSHDSSSDSAAAAGSHEAAKADESATGSGSPESASERAALRRDVYRWLSATAAPLLGVSLDDLCGETEPVNIPGVDEETHPSWSRRMTVPLEQLAHQEGVSDLWNDLSERGGHLPSRVAGAAREKAPGR